MNEYLRNLNKIEFVLTYACTGRCKHCSEGEHTASGETIDAFVAADIVRKVASEYDIKTVMVFGGEPLLRVEATEKIMRAASESGVPRRQVITNGYFAKDSLEIRAVARLLCECGVNDLLISVDAFHQQTIPIEIVKEFAVQATALGIPTRFQPAWLVSKTHGNPYNLETRKILDSLNYLGIPESEGNIVFPEGNALKYLSEYFRENVPENPYVENPCDVRCISISPNGDVLGGNAYRTDIMTLIEGYSPTEDGM